jgi:hypothetical protein
LCCKTVSHGPNLNRWTQYRENGKCYRKRESIKGRATKEIGMDEKIIFLDRNNRKKIGKDVLYYGGDREI